MDHWMIVGAVGMVATIITTYQSKIYKDIDVGIFIGGGVIGLGVHIGLAAWLPQAKASPEFERGWGRVVQGFAFLACLFVSGLPNLVLVSDEKNVWPLIGLIVWGLGIEMALGCKLGGNIFNLTLGVAFTVGLSFITNPSNKKYVGLGYFLALGVPIIGTIIYQCLVPTSFRPPIVPLILTKVRGDDGPLCEATLYRFVRVDHAIPITPRTPRGRVKPEGGVLGVINIQLPSPQPIVMYELVAEKYNIGVDLIKEFQLTDVQTLSAFEVFSITLRELLLPSFIARILGR